MAAGQTETVPPVFLTTRSLPAADEKEYTVFELCTAAERAAGYGKVLGSQRIGSLWRIYTKDTTARIDLLTRGLILRGHTVQVRDTNPFLRANERGEKREIPTTRLTIGNIPMTHPNEEILEFLKKVPGFKAVSRIMDERARDEKGKLSNWKTGRRFIFIETPATPLPKSVKMGPFSVSLFHKEQKPPTCSNCLETTHHASVCTAPVKCRVCLQSGHKMGDSKCELAPPPPSTTADEETEENDTNSLAETSSAQTESDSAAGVRPSQSPAKHKTGRKTRSRSSPPASKKRNRSPSTPQQSSKAARPATTSTTGPEPENKEEIEEMGSSNT